ncbi:MAG: GntR family transcriptional regulator [Thermodesulfobacteriota bacterium]
MLHKVKNTSLVEKVGKQIEEAILTGEYRPGDRLPSSRQLQAILGASLGTIREALAILEQKGLITIKKGTKGGAFVREPSTDMVSDSLELLMRHSKLTPLELAEFRQNVEAGLVRLVLRKASLDEIRRLASYRGLLRSCLGQGEAGWINLLKIESRLRKDMIAITGNRTYKAVLEPIHDNIVTYAARYLRGNDDLTQKAYDYWDQILSALERQDGETAANLTEDMIHYFMINMIKSELVTSDGELPGN